MSYWTPKEIEVIAWLQKFDPHYYMTEVQRMVVTSALYRGDFEKAKQLLVDWKITQRYERAERVG